MGKKNPIGIFDSGIGGLLIAKEIKLQMPNENFIYFGDTINMPYGNKTKKFIINNSIKIVSFLYKKKCKALIIACNSITSNAIDMIVKKFNNKILIFNVINPIIKEKIFLSSRRIGILGTPATINSNFYIKCIKKYYNNIDIIQISIPLLANFIERNLDIIKIKKYLINNYLINLKSIDVLILACTHYLFIKNEISSFYKDKNVHIIDIQKIVVKEIKEKLNEKNLLNINSNYKKNYIFYYTLYNDFFKKKVNTLFGKNVIVKKHIFKYY